MTFPPSALIILTFLLFPVDSETRAAGKPEENGVHGTIFSTLDKRPIKGTTVIATSTDGKAIQRTISDDRGRYAFSGLSPGRYEIRAEMKGFEPERQFIDILKQNEVSIDFYMNIARLEENIEVQSSRLEELKTSSSGEIIESRLMDLAPLKGDNYQALLPLVPGVVRTTDGRISFKGAQPTQSALLVGAVDATDVSTGNFGYELPLDAIENVDVLPNPYSTEYGRFSSGLAQVATRKGDNKWRFGLNNFIPKLKWRDGTLMGIGSIAPRLTARGPLIRDRLFLAQSMRYRHTITRVPGLPDLHNDQLLESFENFSRMDVNLSNNHALTATAAVFPRKQANVGLNSLNIIEVTPDYRQRGFSIVLADNLIISPKMVLDSVVSYKRYDADIKPHGDEPMKLMVGGNRGNFFNQQERRTRSLQFAQAVTSERSGRWGSHLYKVGYDVMHSSLDDQSRSHPVEVFNGDGEMTARINFSAQGCQRVRSTDFALFAQDGWRVNDRLRIDLGFRLDRNGVLGELNFSPRAGLTLAVLQQGNIVIRGGAGFFFGRTPLNVGAFSSYESRTITKWPGKIQEFSISYRHVMEKPLVSPYGFIWNIEYDHRLANSLIFKVNHLRRNGFHELILDRREESQRGELVLASRGRSRYWETEISFRYYRDEDHKLIWSYVRSRSQADLNSYDLFFGNFREPFIQRNQFSLASVDVPHRFIWRGVMPVWKGWLASPVLEIRNGFPYSVIDENRGYVGIANRGGRFPYLMTVDLSVSRKIKILRWKPRVGMQVYNLLNRFNSRDVQNNIASPAFRGFYNKIPRSLGLILQFEP